MSIKYNVLTDFDDPPQKIYAEIADWKEPDWFIERAANAFREAQARLTEVARHRPLTKVEERVLDKATAFLAIEEGK